MILWTFQTYLAVMEMRRSEGRFGGGIRIEPGRACCPSLTAPFVVRWPGRAPEICGAGQLEAEQPNDHAAPPTERTNTGETNWIRTFSAGCRRSRSRTRPKRSCCKGSCTWHGPWTQCCGTNETRSAITLNGGRARRLSAMTTARPTQSSVNLKLCFIEPLQGHTYTVVLILRGERRRFTRGLGHCEDTGESAHRCHHATFAVGIAAERLRAILASTGGKSASVRGRP